MMSLLTEILYITWGSLIVFSMCAIYVHQLHIRKEKLPKPDWRFAVATHVWSMEKELDIPISEEILGQRHNDGIAALDPEWKAAYESAQQQIPTGFSQQMSMMGSGFIHPSWHDGISNNPVVNLERELDKQMANVMQEIGQLSPSDPKNKDLWAYEVYLEKKLRVLRSPTPNSHLLRWRDDEHSIVYGLRPELPQCRICSGFHYPGNLCPSGHDGLP